MRTIKRAYQTVTRGHDRIAIAAVEQGTLVATLEKHTSGLQAAVSKCDRENERLRSELSKCKRANQEALKRWVAAKSRGREFTRRLAIWRGGRVSAAFTLLSLRIPNVVNLMLDFMQPVGPAGQAAVAFLVPKTVPRQCSSTDCTRATSWLP
eukprot:TRINITY_DN9267_c0_g1_i2.p1 TRINITY_DN9267_c0_g1~~TRINITY_DN9267_c0_g1_i2.p1  ORF type:complete len:166 (-),score=14.34 TRINITY_DN9267_c0_g1_i2:28-483(-)